MCRQGGHTVKIRSYFLELLIKIVKCLYFRRINTYISNNSMKGVFTVSHEKKKQVLHVKELTIKADRVIIEQPKHFHRDPFFRPIRRDERKGDQKKK